MSVWKRVNHLTEDEVSHFFRSSLERCHSVRGSLEWQPLMLSVPMVVLLTADLLLCLIISLLITACWTGAYLLSNWLLDVLLLPDSPFMSMLSCLFTGVCGTSVLALLAPKLLLSWEATDNGRMSQPESPRIWSRLRFVVCSRSYTLLCFLLTVVLCKGWWQACVHIAPAFPASALVLLMGLLTSLTLGRLDCGIGAPFVINIDNVATYSHLANVAQVNDNHQLVSDYFNLPHTHLTPQET